MKRLVEEFSGDYRVMRVIFSTSDPLQTLRDLDDKISYRKFIQYLEYLDAKTTIEEDAARKQRIRMEQEQRKDKK